MWGVNMRISPELDLASWTRFLRAHAAVTRELSADLVSEHGLTINDYEVLLRLSRAPAEGLKRVELAQQVLLTPSGITRLLAGLERAGYVERAECESDARVSYARLTDEGLEKLRAAARTHLAGVERVYLERFSEEERATLAELLGRLAGDDGLPCEPD
jgi:DNA-binding MarR family transcriptional regulator